MMIESLKFDSVGNKYKTTRTITEADKDRALKSMNSDLSDGMGNSIPDMPDTLGGVGFNLLRANLDEADEKVKEIDVELAKMDKSRQLLLLEREAYETLHQVAVKYMNLIDDFTGKSRS